MSNMRQSDADEIDFKPFFDAVVGILFVLLILISAQLFFTQWGNVAQEDPGARARQTLIEWEKQTAIFLEGLAEQLRTHGLNPVLNLLDKSISLPLSDVVALDSAQWPQLNSQPELIGELLLKRLNCLPGQVQPRPPECPALELLHLRRVNVELQVGLPNSAPLPADRYAEYLRVIFDAALIRAAPGLLTVVGADASRTVRSSSRAGALADPQPAALLGDVALRFVFDAPAGKPGPDR